MRLSRHVPFDILLVHSVIADVASYPLFVPGIKNAHIIPQSTDIFDADLDVHVLGKYHTYRSRVYVEPASVRSEATTFMGKLNVGWHLKEIEKGTRVDFHLTTSIPGFDWLMPGEWPIRIMDAFATRCSNLSKLKA